MRRTPRAQQLILLRRHDLRHLMAELFPSSIRGTAQGLCYNAGRAVSALAPFTIGALADAYGLGIALASTSAFFLAGALLVLLLPETRGEELT